MAQMTFTHRLQPSLTWPNIPHLSSKPRISQTPAKRLVLSCRIISQVGVPCDSVVLKDIVKNAQVIRVVLSQVLHAMRKVDPHVRLEQNRLLPKPAR